MRVRVRVRTGARARARVGVRVSVDLHLAPLHAGKVEGPQVITVAQALLVVAARLEPPATKDEHARLAVDGRAVDLQRADVRSVARPFGNGPAGDGQRLPGLVRVGVWVYGYGYGYG